MLTQEVIQQHLQEFERYAPVGAYCVSGDTIVILPKEHSVSGEGTARLRLANWEFGQWGLPGVPRSGVAFQGWLKRG